VGITDPAKHKQITWEKGPEMNEPRYFFGCCAFKDESIYVFGGMNQDILKQSLSHGESKCLNSIERFIIDEQRWVTIELKTY
jgi:Kelch motif